MPEPNFICEQCGKSGYKESSQLNKFTRHFCSRECSSKSLSKKQEVKCIQCNKLFMKSFASIQKYPNHFCSKSCHGNFRNKKREVECIQCNKLFLKSFASIQRYPNNFCSKSCVSNFQNKKQEVECLVCDNLFEKKLSEIISNPRHCCSRECYLVLQKYHKDWGSSRSKLEIEVEIALKKLFHFEILFNKTTIGYELDIDIPCLDLAFEINGITHYKAIFGEEKFIKRQQIDKEKAEECLKINKHLIVINVSEDKQSKRVRQQRINEIIQIINNRIAERNYKPKVKQLIMEI